MTILDATTLTPDQLAVMLRDWAQGVPTEEAATGLVIAHRTWLSRRDFLAQCVNAVDDGIVGERRVPMAAISWPRTARFADNAPAARSEVAVLRLACSLGGVDTGALSDLTSGLDVANTTRVLDALAHRAGWHWRGETHTVDGYQDGARPAPTTRGPGHWA